MLHHPSSSIAVITSGKYAVLSPEIVPQLVNLLGNKKSEIRLNSIKLISLLSETPKGKEDFKCALEKVSGLLSSTKNAVFDHLYIAG